MKRFVCGCLMLSMLAGVLASCNDVDVETKQPADTTTISETTTAAPKGGNLPDGLLFNGETVRVMYQNNGFFMHDTQLNDEQVGELVSDTLLARNRKTEEDLNITFEWIPGNLDWDIYPADVNTAILAGEVPGDVVLFDASRCISMALDGVFHEVSELPYIDDNNPWWHRGMMENLMVNGEKYMLTGGNSLATMINTSATVFNKDMFTDVFGDVNQLYDLVEARKWTLDKLIEYSKAVYVDENGDGTRDSEDTYGIVTLGGVATNLTRSIGLTYEKINDDGKLVLDIYNDQILSLVDKMRTLFWGGEASYHAEWDYNMLNHFAEGRSLFMLHSLDGYASEQMRAMEPTYGIIPNPVLEEGMEYFSHTMPVVSVIPVTEPTERFNLVAAVLEKLAYEGYENVIPAWYEIAMKDKLADNQRDADMIDLIYETMNTAKFSSVFPAYFYNVVEGKIPSNKYTSYHKANSAAMEAQWAEMFH